MKLVSDVGFVAVYKINPVAISGKIIAWRFIKLELENGKQQISTESVVYAIKMSEHPM